MPPEQPTPPRAETLTADSTEPLDRSLSRHGAPGAIPDIAGSWSILFLWTPARCYTYVIILTSNAEKENVVKGLSAGADDYLTKPFDPDELLARVRVGLRLIDLHRQIEGKNRLLEELALTDPLTGLPNRRAVVAWGGRQAQRRRAARLCLLGHAD
ncbi:MAG: response regulator [Candidatus Acidiferrales bacterium]|jgi:DNA-binding response OmpR family regulator